METLTLASSADTMPLVQELAQSLAAARPGIRVELMQAEGEQMTSLLQDDVTMAVVLGQPDALPPSLRAYELARQPISVIVHHENTLKALTLDALSSLYAGRATDWRQVGGAAAPVMILAREPGAPMRRRWDQIVLGSGSRLTPNALILPSDEAMIATVARRPEAIGYVSGAVSLTSVRTLTIEGETPSGIARGRAYPLWQSVSLIYRAPTQPAVQSFISYLRSKAGQRIVASLGYGQGGDVP